MNKPVVLCILDGWGITEKKEFSAVDKANTAFFDSLIANYPHCKLNLIKNIYYKRRF